MSRIGFILFCFIGLSLSTFLSVKQAQHDTLVFTLTHSKIELLCYKMLESNVLNDDLMLLAYESNEILDVLQNKLTHPLQQYWVHDSLATVKYIECNLDKII